MECGSYPLPESYRPVCEKLSELFNRYFDRYKEGVSDYTEYTNYLRVLPTEEKVQVIEILNYLKLEPNLFLLMAINFLAPYFFMLPPTRRDDIRKIVIGRKDLVARPDGELSTTKSDILMSHAEEVLSTVKYDVLYGPISLSYFTKGDRRIYVAGDRHEMVIPVPDETVDIITINRFLVELSHKSPVFVDIFLEHPYYPFQKRYTPKTPTIDADFQPVERHSSPNYLERVMMDFDHCVYPKYKYGARDYSGCSRLSRIHWIDIRDDKVFGQMIMAMFFLDVVNEAHSDSLEELKKTAADQMDYIRGGFNLKCSDQFKTFDDYVQYILKIGDPDIDTKFPCGGYERKIVKELANCSSEDSKAIMEFIRNEAIHYPRPSRELIPPQQLYKNWQLFLEDKFDFDELMQETKDYTIPLSLISLIQDYYCLARLFRKYQITRGSDGDGKETEKVMDFKKYHPSQSLNSFIYVGDHHAETLRKFFRQQGYKEYQFPASEKAVDIKGHPFFFL